MYWIVCLCARVTLIRTIAFPNAGWELDDIVVQVFLVSERVEALEDELEKRSEVLRRREVTKMFA